MAVEYQAKRFEGNVLPSPSEADALIDLLKSNWTVDGMLLYAYAQILFPQEWSSPKGLVGREIQEGRMRVSAVPDTRIPLIATASLLNKNGHVELGRVASHLSPDYRGAGGVAIADTMRAIQEQGLPGAIIDIASLRTTMTSSAKKNSQGMPIVSLYVTHPAFGKPEVISWGCFGDYVINQKFLRETGKQKLSLPIPQNLPRRVEDLLGGIAEINNDFMENSRYSSYTPSSLLRSEVLFNGEIVEVDIHDEEVMKVWEERGYYPSGVVPVLKENDLQWKLRYCKGKIPDVINEPMHTLRREKVAMYSTDPKQRKLASLIQSLYPSETVTQPVILPQRATLG